MNTSEGTRMRLAIAAAAGLMVTIIALAASWRQFTGGADGAKRQKATQALIMQVDKAIALYRQEYGSLPDVLGDLFVLKGFELPQAWGPKELFLDPWGVPLGYNAQGTDYEVVSVGRDWHFGGIGIDCDISNKNLDPPEAHATFWMFLTSPARRETIVSCIVCGILAFGVACFTTGPRDVTTGPRWWLAFKILWIICGATLVAMVMAILHFMPRGH